MEVRLGAGKRDGRGLGLVQSHEILPPEMPVGIPVIGRAVGGGQRGDIRVVIASGVQGVRAHVGGIGHVFTVLVAGHETPAGMPAIFGCLRYM